MELLDDAGATTSTIYDPFVPEVHSPETDQLGGAWAFPGRPTAARDIMRPSSSRTTLDRLRGSGRRLSPGTRHAKRLREPRGSRANVGEGLTADHQSTRSRFQKRRIWSSQAARASAVSPAIRSMRKPKRSKPL